MSEHRGTAPRQQEHHRSGQLPLEASRSDLAATRREINTRMDSLVPHDGTPILKGGRTGGPDHMPRDLLFLASLALNLQQRLWNCRSVLERLSPIEGLPWQDHTFVSNNKGLKNGPGAKLHGIRQLLYNYHGNYY